MDIDNIPEDWSNPMLRSVSSINPTRKNWPLNPTVSFFEMAQVSEEGRMSNGVSGPMSSFSTGFTPFMNGDVILAKITPCFENGKGAYVQDIPSGYGLGSTEFHVVRAGADMDSKFFYFLSTCFWFRKNGERNMTGSAGQKRVPTDWLKTLKVPLPPLPEQKKIAEILGACDEAIEAQERLIAQKQQRKKGLMQQLLTGETRFPQFAGTPWKSVKIGSLLKEVKRYVDWDDEERYQLLSLRRRSGGPFARESLLGSQIKTKTLKTVHAEDFLIAKMQVTHGALGMVTGDFDGWKVSDSYICMVPHDADSFDVRFFNYLSQDRYIWHLAYVSSYGVAIEKMTFVLKDFLKKEISVPPTKEEAAAIADCIDAANEEIILQQNKLEQLKQQKKGLMQQLLTGKVRVKV